MRVILSRKGFDSENGGGPSPILPDGQILSLPIPSDEDALRYSDLRFGEGTYADLFGPLGYGALTKRTCHLDPDIRPEALERLPGWTPAFGQTNIAERHLSGQGIGPGDLFLFFGWFRQTRRDADGTLRFDPADRGGRHLIYGYLQVGIKLAIGPTSPLEPWLESHPHANRRRREHKSNAIYVAGTRLSWNQKLPGAGPLRFHPALVLTQPGQSRSRWGLPELFRGLKITYHSAESWREGYFQSAPKGQEFVVEESAAVEQWARALIEGN